MYRFSHSIPRHAETICMLGTMNQYLIHRSINLDLEHEIKQLQHIDQHLLWLLHKSSSFNFVG